MNTIEMIGIYGLLFLLPGFISYKIYMQLRTEQKMDAWEKTMNVLMFAIIDYSIIFFILRLLYRDKLYIIKNVEKILDAFIVTKISNIIWVGLTFVLTSIVISVIAAILYRTNIINRFFHKIHLSDVIDNDSVLENIMKDPKNNPEQRWTITIGEKKLTGIIDKYTPASETVELFLTDVIESKIGGEGVTQTTTYRNYYICPKKTELVMYTETK
ncbi:MAG: DUF6338 family protein [Bacteroidales bacterium]|nr:DUF6338 family protein [Bacteroidales bacterium]